MPNFSYIILSYFSYITLPPLFILYMLLFVHSSTNRSLISNYLLFLWNTNTRFSFLAISEESNRVRCNFLWIFPSFSVPRSIWILCLSYFLFLFWSLRSYICIIITIITSINVFCMVFSIFYFLFSLFYYFVREFKF